MTQQTIDIQALPSQTFQVSLGSQNCLITLQQMNSGLFISLSIAGKLIIAGKYCNDRVSLIRQAYLGFVGWLYFVDTLGSGLDPYYTGLGTRYVLVYES